MNVFSTCWNSRRQKDGNYLCDEILELGFNKIEASHGFSTLLLPGLFNAVDEGRIEVMGVHNFFPSPLELKSDAPDAFQFTSHREWERSRALRLTLETLENAARLKARYVVLHMGRVHFLRTDDGTRKLQRMARHGALGTKEYAQLKKTLLREREKLSTNFYARAVDTLHQLVEKARELNLVLGVEGRSHFEQVPSEWELHRIFTEFKDEPHVRYWHDFGHIQRQHNLLILDHEQFLEGMQPYLYGAHVNDVQWPARDHRPPFGGSREGGVDFETLLPRFFKKDMPLTWELSSSVKAEVIREMKVYWDELCATL